MDAVAPMVNGLLEAEKEEAFEIVAGRLGPGLLLVCDHARNWVPDALGMLGLPPQEFERHIAYDIGAEAVTREIGARLGVPFVMSRFSRLLIDPNRGQDDPTMIMMLSDGAIIPTNKMLDKTGREERVSRFYKPYDDAVGRCIEAFDVAGVVPVIVSVHSFTPSWKGVPRPWEISLLWDDDPRLIKPMLAELRKDQSICVGENEPYSGQLPGDTMYRHATARGLAHALIELRQDEISHQDGQQAWGKRIADVLRAVLSHDELQIELRTRRVTVDEMIAVQD